MAILLIVGYRMNFDYAVEAIASTMLLFVLYTVCKRPYKSKLDNLGIIMNELMVLYFILWMVARKLVKSLTQ